MRAASGRLWIVPVVVVFGVAAADKNPRSSGSLARVPDPGYSADDLDRQQRS
jgi:hypothetical protein